MTQSTFPTERRKRADRPRKPTITDVAKAAGVSAAAVSYVLNGRLKEVSPATAERVLEKVRELGYVKNLAAAALTGQKSRMIAVIIPTLYDPQAGGVEPPINPFYGEFLIRLEHEARTRGYAICFHTGREEENVQFLLQRNMDAAVLVGFSEWDLPELLRNPGIRCVLFDSHGHAPAHGHVRTNEQKGGYLSAERLIDIGRERLLFIGAKPVADSDNVPSERYRGAQRACDLAGVSLQILEAAVTYDAGLYAAQKVVDMAVDGVVTTADVIAAGLVDGLARLGRSVPGDVAVMGYDNLPICQYTRPQLSSIDQGLREKVQAVMDLVESPEPGAVRIIDPTRVLRQSA
ncbi:MAG: LacI family DNA-binding transcriptional regulator [Kiritimatiellae bacterium]|nr:LacI family DNA-binding transcriptional regulator [Kiritimatiellia bacterium]MCO5062435.1 LacI family transcriptional regulator [Kiritimatiellia bacterium]MCO5068681.1 LacI family transcriptional regulator [Kiritimatiellia bacterium]MCO6400628.1 LacI family DNA-binding transcriptional regulator [Verrucomicrobiota bacterium]